jgi:7-cyano-7-deazaguanine synthase in queuosine biosynthesis
MKNKENLLVTCSGGRTSAFMCWWIKDNMSHIYNMKFVYANTGLEHEKTLEFVNKVDSFFNLNLVWIEANIDQEKGKGTDYKITDYKNATRDNSLFVDLCKKYGLPNQTYIHCTRELKNQPMLKYAKDIFKNETFRQALGIRADEIRRVKISNEFIYPLQNIINATKKDVLDFWEKQPFNLEIEEHYGNCVGCYKKSDKKLKMIADENPHYFDAFIDLEINFSNIKNAKEEYERKIYRHHRTAFEVKHNLNLPNLLQVIDDCAEECGSVIVGASL